MELAKYLLDNVENCPDVTRHIINSISIEKMEQLLMELGYYTSDSRTGLLLYYIDKKLFPIQKEDEPKTPNAPISQLLADFGNDKSGRIAISRAELQKRFDYQSLEDQMRIMDAFMRRATKHDVVWCAKHLLNDWFWLDYYIDVVEWYWERDMDNNKLLKVIIKYASEEYLKEKVEMIENQTDGLIESKAYTSLLSYLGKDKSFAIKKERLKPYQYAYICAKTNRCVSHDDANSALLQAVSDELSEGFFVNRFRRTLDGAVVFDAKGKMGLALWIMAKTGNTTVLIHFNEWTKEMCHKIERMQAVDYDKITEVISDSLAE
jgi:hypothetical protein